MSGRRHLGMTHSGPGVVRCVPKSYDSDIVEIDLRSELAQTPDLTGRIDNYTRPDGFQNGYLRQTWRACLAGFDDGELRAVAVKYLEKQNWRNLLEVEVKQLIDGMKLRNSLYHEHILPVAGYTTSTPSEGENLVFGVVTPWMENGTVINYLRRNPSGDRQKLVRVDSLVLNMKQEADCRTFRSAKELQLVSHIFTRKTSYTVTYEG